MSDAARAILETEDEIDSLDNVEFIGQALKDPLNVLRVKMKELGEIAEDTSIAIRRVIVITEYMTEDGRSTGIMFSEREHETDLDAEESVLATLTRLQASMALE